MILLSSKRLIEYTVRLETVKGFSHFKVEIDDSQIILRADSIMTEVSIKNALKSPSYIRDAILTLNPFVTSEEVEELTRHICFRLK